MFTCLRLSTLFVLLLALLGSKTEATAKPLSLSEVCRWVTANGSNPFEWLNQNEVVQIKEQSERIFKLMDPRFRELLYHLDGRRPVSLEFELKDKTQYAEIVRRLGMLGINRITSNSWMGLPHRETWFYGDWKITVFEKNPHALLYAIRTVTDLDPGAKTSVDYKWFEKPLSNIERLMLEDHAVTFQNAKPEEKLEVSAQFRLNRPHFLYRSKEFRSMPGIEVVDEYFNRAQPYGYLILRGTKDVLRKALALDEIDLINLRDATEVKK